MSDRGEGLAAALKVLVERLEATPEELRGPFLVKKLRPYLGHAASGSVLVDQLRLYAGNHPNDYRNQAADRIEALSAKLKLAEAVLEPFAKFDVGLADEGIFSIPDGHPLLGEGLGDSWRPAVTVGDFRAARATLHSIRED